LTHTAGFAYEIWQEPILRYQEATGTPGIISCQDRALTTPLLFDPGERWEYGINIDWAGKMVEAVSGQKLGAYLKANLFEPLGIYGRWRKVQLLFSTFPLYKRATFRRQKAYMRSERLR